VLKALAMSKNMAPVAWIYPHQWLSVIPTVTVNQSYIPWFISQTPTEPWHHTETSVNHMDIYKSIQWELFKLHKPIQASYTPFYECYTYTTFLCCVRHTKLGGVVRGAYGRMVSSQHKSSSSFITHKYVVILL